MANLNLVFTSESVSEGHPDKVADQISDAILDACIQQDPHSRVACETLVKNNTIVLAGEIRTNAKVDYEAIARGAVRKIGYTEKELGFDADSAEIIHLISEQSADIAMGVDVDDEKAKELGAGDQGLMFGFACDETPSLMPLPISLSHSIVKELARLRKNGETFLKPDAKSQVSVRYVDGRPVEVTAVVLSTQHAETYSLEALSDYVIKNVIKKIIPAELLSDKTNYLINPTGRFVIGGPVGDCGLTGRKIIVDSYGGYARHGGGAYSGKDPTKVDRSACYAARYVAKNIVAAKLARRCEVQLAYAIGVVKPVSLYVDTGGTGKVADAKLEAAVREIFDLRPAGIIEMLSLRKPIYQETAAYGHFGREPTTAGAFPWEKTDKIEELIAGVK